MNSMLRGIARLALPSISALGFAWTAPAALAQTPDLAGIAHVAIRVSDLQRSRDFFHKLGFEEAFALDRGGAPTEAFFKINDRQFIELYPARGSDQAVGFMHICFETGDINGVHQDYVAHGLAPTPVKRAGAGNLLFTMQGPVEPGDPSDLRPAATQNIEYTQYMPGSRHTLDRGHHLGPDRIADRIAGVGIPMADPDGAADYYAGKLSFRHATKRMDGNLSVLTLPGTPGQWIALLAASEAVRDQQREALHFQIIFSVTSTRHAAARLRDLGLAVKKSRSRLIVDDPDGDELVFMKLGASPTEGAQLRTVR